MTALHWPLRGAALVLAAAALLLPQGSPAQSVATETTATWPSASLTRGADRYVTGTAGADATRVALEQHVLGGWRSVTSSTVDDSGSYRLKVPTWWLGTRTYRVTSDTASSTSWQTTVSPTYVPRGTRSQFRYSFDSVTRWDPCTVIGYRVNLQQATRGALADTKAAFSRMSQATGYRFAYRGRTSRYPSNGGNSWYPSDTQIVVAWARPSQSSLLAMYPGAAGVGAAMSRSGYYNGDGTRTGLIVKGMVVIDSRQKMGAGFGAGLTRGDTLLHEIGHTMGLSHSGSSEQMMYAYLTRTKAAFGRGDLHGLEARGAKLGCVRTSPVGRTTSVSPRVSALRTAP